IPQRSPGAVRIHVARKAGKGRGGAAHESQRKQGPTSARAARPKRTSSSKGEAPGQLVADAHRSAPPAASGGASSSASRATSSGGGQPSAPSPGGGTAKIAPVAVPTLDTRPGRGCGDKNHIHARANECH